MPRDLDKQSQKVHVFKNIKNNSLTKGPFQGIVFNVFKYLKTLKTIKNKGSFSVFNCF